MLHNHSEYSLLDSICKIEDMYKKAQELNYSALSITDHGNMYATIKHYLASKKYNIKPIYGCEFYIVEDVNIKFKKGEANHLILLAKNNKGLENLYKLVTIANENFYYEPRIDNNILKNYTEGLICLSACIVGNIPYYILNDIKEAERLILLYKELFGEDFYIEIQEHGIPNEEEINRKLLEYSRKYNIKTVITNDAHYINKEDSKIHDIYLCIQTNKKLNDEKRLRFTGDSFYFTRQGLLQHLDFTEEIINKCNVTINFYDIIFPKVILPKKYNNAIEWLRDISYTALVKRDLIWPEYIDRLDSELNIIDKMGYATYFYVINDIKDFCQKNDIIYGCGRGSASASLILYLLECTDVNPLKYNLLFSRFINESRVSPPDFDQDFSINHRKEIIEYITKKYKHVLQIATFQKYNAKQAIKDIGRVLDIDFTIMNDLTTNFIHNDKIEENLDNKDFINYCNKNNIWEVIGMAKKIEGLPKSVGRHAAGIIIADKDLSYYTPIQRIKQEYACSYDMKDLEKIGLLKIDILGLDTLDIISETIKLANFDITGIKNDDNVYNMISNGNVAGCFQIDTDLNRKIIMEYKPRNIEDLGIIMSISRPGFLKTGLYKELINRRMGLSKVTYLHPELEDILNVSYGMVVYQEQVIRIAIKLAGFTETEADNLRRGIGKKIPEEITRYKDLFIEGCIKNNIDKEIAEELFKIIDASSGYIFNKPHAISYALTCYRTAYLKYHFPIQFLCALLNNSENEKYNYYINSFNVNILLPNINNSESDFIIYNNNIVWGLKHIKGMGEKAVKVILEERKMGNFKNKEDFVSRTPRRPVTKRIIDILERVGIFGDDTEMEDEEELFGCFISKSPLNGCIGHNVYYINDITEKISNKGNKYYILKLLDKKGIYKFISFRNTFKKRNIIKILQTNDNIIQKAVVLQ